MDEKKDIPQWQFELFANLHTMYQTGASWEVCHGLKQIVRKLCLDHFKLPFSIFEEMVERHTLNTHSDYYPNIYDMFRVLINASGDPTYIENVTSDKFDFKNGAYFLLDDPGYVAKYLEFFPNFMAPYTAVAKDPPSPFAFLGSLSLPRFLWVALRQPKYFERTLRYLLNNYPEGYCLFFCLCLLLC